MFFLFLFLIASPLSLESAELITKTFTVTVEPGEDISVSGAVTINSGFVQSGTSMVVQDTSTTMDLQSPSGSTKVLNVKLDAVPAGYTVSTWIAAGSPTGTGTIGYTSSGSSLSLTTTDAAIISGMDNYAFTGATIGFEAAILATASESAESLTVTWTIADAAV